MIKMEQKQKKQLKKLLIIAVVAVLVALPLLQITGLVDILSLTPSDFHTGISPSSINYCNTQRFWQDCWEGQSMPGIGYPYKEMMPDVKYVTSFSGATGSNALSERISIVGNMYADDWIAITQPIRGYYKVSIKENPTSTVWTPIIDLNWDDPTKVVVVGGTGWKACQGIMEHATTLTPIEIRLIGSHVGAMKVEARYEFRSSFPVPFPEYWQKTMSVDYAYLISGEGSINIAGYQSWQTPTFEIGETVPIQYSVDYSGATFGEPGRWELWAFPLRGGSGRLLTTFGDYERSTYNWELPADAWVRNTDNGWRLELKNTLFPTDAVDFRAIDIRANAPPTPTVTITPASPQVGSMVTISASANTNQFTNEAVQSFLVKVTRIATNTQLIYKFVSVDPGHADPYTASDTFNMCPCAGDVYVQVWAHDMAGSDSAVPYAKTVACHAGLYRLSLTVLDEYNAFPLVGVRVQPTGGTAKTTNAQGKCWFDLNAGSYSFQFTKAGYTAKTGSWTLSSSDRNEVFHMTKTSNTWDLTVAVETKDGNTVWGATVSAGATQLLTDQTGKCVFYSLAEGEYNIVATHGNMTGSLAINLDKSHSITIILGESGGGEYIDPFIILGAVAAIAIVGVGVYMYYMERRKK